MRGEIVPCLWLREVFAIEGQPPAIEPVVVVTVEGTRIGIAVDRVVGEYQTVIKNLGPLYRDVEEFSGATIRGDGTMARAGKTIRPRPAETRKRARARPEVRPWSSIPSIWWPRRSRARSTR